MIIIQSQENMLRIVLYLNVFNALSSQFSVTNPLKLMFSYKRIRIIAFK